MTSATTCCRPRSNSPTLTTLQFRRQALILLLVVTGTCTGFTLQQQQRVPPAFRSFRNRPPLVPASSLQRRGAVPPLAAVSVDTDESYSKQTSNKKQQALVYTNNNSINNIEPPPAALRYNQQERIVNDEYQRGLLTIGFCTLVFASLSPVMHAALTSTTGAQEAPPVLFLNAVVSVVACISVAVGGPWLESILPKVAAPPTAATTTTTHVEKSTSIKGGDNNVLLSSSLSTTPSSRAAASPSWLYNPWIGGAELGLWKSLGTTANLFGLSLTTADHGAFLIQLTTLIVPTVQGLMGVPISQRIQTSIALALCGVALFTQDHTTTAAGTTVAADTVWMGDALCVVAAAFYATYDLRLYQWGQRIASRPLITSKVLVQATLSVALLLGGLGLEETGQLLTNLFESSSSTSTTLLMLIAWSGIMVNALVPFLQVGGQQAIGPTRSQTLYASQPLWAAIMSYAFLEETVGIPGLVGGGAFLGALFLAATAPPPQETAKTTETTTIAAGTAATFSAAAATPSSRP